MAITNTAPWKGIPDAVYHISMELVTPSVPMNIGLSLQHEGYSIAVLQLQESPTF
jgi:hypothetical protein